MKRLITIDIAATETHCGECRFADGREHCDVFKRRVLVYDFERGCEELRRLPECIAAEGKRE